MLVYFMLFFQWVGAVCGVVSASVFLFRLTILPAELLDLWFPLPGQQGGPVQRRILGTVCFG